MTHPVSHATTKNGQNSDAIYVSHCLYSQLANGHKKFNN